MTKIVHVLGNGDRANLFLDQQRDGMLLLCNMPPFEVDPKKVFATCMVDFKMMQSLTLGEIELDAFEWILGTRPRIWMYEQSNFYLKYANRVKEFYTHVPEYAVHPTNFNCGHMAVHYAAAKQRADEIHLYGFDTIFDFNMRSVTDLILSSDRTTNNNYRLLNNWRPVWRDIFLEFPNTKFVLHHNHDKLKIPLLDNMEVKVYNKPITRAQEKKDISDISDGRGMKDPSIILNRKLRRQIAAQSRKNR